jgi:hypothetical protein
MPVRVGNAASSAAATGGGQAVSLCHVLIALATCLVLSVVIDAPGLVHSAHGMPDGAERAVALQVGQDAAAVGDLTHLTVIWDTLAAAHGYSPQPSVPPLLASSPPEPARTKGHRRPGRGGSRSAHGRTRTCAAGCRHSTPATVAVPRSRPVTRARPLRLLITGDSLTEFMGPDLINDVSAVAPVRGYADTHYGTGLVRPDFVDWSIVARQQVAADSPEATVVLMGGNDFQNMVTAGGRILYTGTKAWTAEYERRAEVCMRIWAQGGSRRIYWLAMPPARETAWSEHNAEINAALRLAARQVRGAEFLNLNGPVTNHGQYADFVPVGGQPLLVREPDGIHFNEAGSGIVAHEMLVVLEREWHLLRRS